LLTYVNQNRISKEFIFWANQDIIYRNANYLVDYASFKSMSNLPLEEGLIDTTVFPVTNDNALISYYYRAHLN
jgi:hypothetical protein